jgi:hypothetical protein
MHHRDKTACPQGHPYDEQNTRWYRGRRYCKACNCKNGNQWRERKRAELGEVLPPGLTRRQAAAKTRWALRREKFGPSGVRPEIVARLREEARLRILRNGNQHSGKTHCCRGHKYQPGSYYVGKRGNRQCKACMLIHVGQKRWRTAAEKKRAAAVVLARAYMIDVGIRANREPDSAYWRARYEAAIARWQKLKQAA